MIDPLRGDGSLSYGELAGERMKLGLMLHDPGEEQDCFSDNTHNAHYDDAQGIANVYLGRYRRVDGSTVAGPSLSDLVRARDPALDDEMRARLDATQAAVRRIKATADRGLMAYDQMIGEGNPEGTTWARVWPTIGPRATHLGGSGGRRRSGASASPKR